MFSPPNVENILCLWLVWDHTIYPLKQYLYTYTYTYTLLSCTRLIRVEHSIFATVHKGFAPDFKLSPADYETGAKICRIIPVLLCFKTSRGSNLSPVSSPESWNIGKFYRYQLNLCLFVSPPIPLPLQGAKQVKKQERAGSVNLLSISTVYSTHILTQH